MEKQKHCLMCKLVLDEEDLEISEELCEICYWENEEIQEKNSMSDYNDYLNSQS